uniref:GLTP domain-containing protein n=1 Tax=Ganoderma boninense TaxID=34458 RepID=A0A5K1K7T8_9APHY|nr:GLTP domain-containing protein [Ganoderma boninense]
MSAIDYTNLPPLPPLPHSVHDFLATPPLTPTPSLVTVATTPGLSRSGTYLVKVHGRTTHSRTEFPRANPPSSPTRPRRKQPPTTPEPVEHDPSDDEDDEEPTQQPRLKAVNFTPKDTSRLYKLRRDPSVASLLDLYDDHGCLDSHVFANDPPSPDPTSPAIEGRAPRPRTGSTFRQLLGAEATFAVNNATEGDLSWAERFLDEQLGDDSSLPSPTTPNVETPKDTLFPDTLSEPLVATHDITLSSLDHDSSTNNPAISSMEVEVSEEEVKDIPVIEVVSDPTPLLPDPKTPQRASEVFGFLSRRNTLTVKERDLPPPPQAITPDTTGNSTRAPHDDFLHPHDTSLGENTDATHSANTSHSSTQLTSSDTNSTTSHAQIQTATMTKLSTAFAASTTSLNLLMNADSAKELDSDLANEITSNHTGTTHATSHTTGSSLSTSNSTKLPASRIPRGPRPRPHSIGRHDTPSPVDLDGAPTHVDDQPGPSRSSDNVASKHAEIPTHPREAFTSIPQRQHRRATSRSSGRDVDAFLEGATAAFLKGPSTFTSTGPSAPQEPAPKHGPRPPRKRSTKPEHVARDKETPRARPPRSPRPPAAPSPARSR